MVRTVYAIAPVRVGLQVEPAVLEGRIDGGACASASAPTPAQVEHDGREESRDRQRTRAPAGEATVDKGQQGPTATHKVCCRSSGLVEELEDTALKCTVAAGVEEILQDAR